jgi:hypothetical protein
MTASNVFRSIGTSGRKTTLNTGFMAAPFGIGCVGATNVCRQRVGTYCKDLFSVHGSKSPFFAQKHHP